MALCRTGIIADHLIVAGDPVYHIVGTHVRGAMLTDGAIVSGDGSIRYPAAPPIRRHQNPAAVAMAALVTALALPRRNQESNQSRDRVCWAPGSPYLRPASASGFCARCRSVPGRMQFAVIR